MLSHNAQRMLPTHNDITLDDYANNMFRFERLHDRWIDLCAKYLRHVFGPSIEGATVLDYAFGRGNWSLAAAKAGADRVIAVDASESNVRRLSNYCRAAEISRVDVLQGNILDSPIQGTADILWIYGILSSVADPDALLTRLAGMRRSDSSLAVLYGYNCPSLRQVIVDLARENCVYHDEGSLAADSFLFVPRARIRARDDLTAPEVLWFTAQQFTDLGLRNGYVPLRWITDFGGWHDQSALDEFAPYVTLCSFQGKANSAPATASHLSDTDITVLAAVGQTVMTAASIDQRRKIAIGLFNTHFSALHGQQPADRAIRENFLFLMHAALRLNIPAEAFPPIAQNYVRAAHAAMTDSPRGLSPALLASSPLAVFLEANTTRF
jgi:hypothetical protein